MIIILTNVNKLVFAFFNDIMQCMWYVKFSYNLSKSYNHLEPKFRNKLVIHYYYYHLISSQLELKSLGPLLIILSQLGWWSNAWFCSGFYSARHYMRYPSNAWDFQDLARNALWSCGDIDLTGLSLIQSMFLNPFTIYLFPNYL